MKRFLLLGFLFAFIFSLIGTALADCPTSISQTFTVGQNQQTFTLTEDYYHYDPVLNQTTICYNLTSNPASTNLSHFVVGMCDDITDVLVSATFNGQDVTGQITVGPDPRTGVDGVKFDSADNGEYCFTFTGNWVLGCTLAALKQGNETAPIQQAIVGLECEHVHTPEAVIGGVKFYDANTNGILDAGEILLPNWKILVTIDEDGGGPNLPNDPFVVYTDASGAWTAAGQFGWTYSVSEAFPTEACWHQTTPVGNMYSGAFASSPTSGLDFGNVCTGPGGGLTLGFWSNKNGQALESAADFSMLTGLNLRNANGSNRDFLASLATNKKDLNTWLLSATATNMANMLSAQLAAMELNVAHGGVSSIQLVYAPGTQSANLAGFAAVGDLMNEANVSLGLNGNTVAAGPTRTYQELLKTILDGLNNGSTSGGYVQSTPCPYTFP